MLKICLVGSSLITSIYAHYLSSLADVYMYEGNEIGGAWQGSKIGRHTTQVFNNIICPMNANEEDFIDKIYRLLVRGNAKIRREDKPISLNCNYSPKNYLLGEFYQYINNTIASDGLKLIHKPISNINITKDQILVNDETYDLILLPENFKIDSLCINSHRVDPMYEEHKSRHFRILYESHIDGTGYSEDFDNIFDRGGICTAKKESIFIGRVRRSKKNIPSNSIINESRYLRMINAKKLEVQENFYLHSFMHNCQDYFNSMRRVNNFVYQYKTKQFVDSFASIANSLEQIKRLIDHK